MNVTSTCCVCKSWSDVVSHSGVWIELASGCTGEVRHLDIYEE